MERFKKIRTERKDVFFFSVLVLLLAFLFYLTPLWINRTELLGMIAFFVPLFFTFGISFYYIKNQSFTALFCSAIVFRILTIGTIPHLSDDWYRFVWDGCLFYQGEDPFRYNPSEFYEMQREILPSYLLEIYPNLNSKNYYSVYPYALQVLFSLPWILGYPENGFFIYQILFLGIEICNLFILKKNKKKELFWFYAANPLVVLESVSQIHPDSILVLFLLLLYQFRKTNYFYFFLFILFHLKLSMYVLLIPAFFYAPKKWKVLGFVFVMSLLLHILTFHLGSQSSGGLGLFLHSFRFNGVGESLVFYILKFANKDFSYLSGGISGSFFGLFLFFYNFHWKKSFSLRIFHLFVLLYLCMPVNHPWYFLPAFAFLPARDLFRGLVWSFFLCTSYLLYADKSPEFSAFFSLFQMAVLGFLLYERNGSHHFYKEF